MFQDGDDYMELDAVQMMVARAETLGVDIVMADFDLVSSNNVKKSSYDKPFWEILPQTEVIDITKHPQALRVSPVPWRKLYRREILLKHNLRFLE